MDQPIKSEIWYYPKATEAFFTKSEYCNYEFPPHFHEHYVFFSVANGVNEGQFCHMKYRVTSGDLLVIHPGEVHSGNSLSHQFLQYQTFCPTESFLSMMFERMEEKSIPIFTQLIPAAGAVIDKFNSLVTYSADGYSNLCMEQLLTDFLWSALALAKKSTFEPHFQSVGKAKIFQAKKFIEDHFMDEFSLAELSQHVGVSTYHFLRSFKALTGLTPYTYLTNFRVEMAKKKMNSTKTLTSIAYGCGFYDQSHFIRHFKNINGALPSKFKA